MPHIRDAQPDDWLPVGAIWRQEAKWLGNGGLAWKRFWEEQTVNEHWIVATLGEAVVGFVHYRLRKDTYRVVYEIAVGRDFRRMGVARELIKSIGLPILLKTNVENLESNAFYRAQGFRLMGETLTRKGKPMNVWEKG